jgi:hypothetical protein
MPPIAAGGDAGGAIAQPAVPASEEAINVVLEDELLISDQPTSVASGAAQAAAAEPKPGGLRDRLNLGRPGTRR